MLLIFFVHLKKKTLKQGLILPQFSLRNIQIWQSSNEITSNTKFIFIFHLQIKSDGNGIVSY